jgi:hypothetical protein
VDEWYRVCCEHSSMLKRHARFYQRVRDLRINDVLYVVSSSVYWRGTAVSTSVSEICSSMKKCILGALLYVKEAHAFLQACHRSANEWFSVCCEHSCMLKRHARIYKRVRDLRMNDVVYVVSPPVCWRGTHFLQVCQRSVDEWCSVCCEHSGMLKRHARFYKRVRDLRMNGVVYIVSTPVCWRGTRISTSVPEICGWMV